jgi:translation initiation factor 1
MGGLFAGTPLERPVTCAVCERPLTQCACPRTAAGGVLLPKDQPARVRRERRSGGKMVTVIDSLDPAASDLPALLRAFKTACAAGGGVVGSTIEIQGDHRDRLVQLLRDRGYPAKAAGG